MTRSAFLTSYGFMELILASQSPYRKILLENLGLTFRAEKSLVDEEQLKREGPADLGELTRFLATHKATSLRKLYPSAVILGSDQLVALDGERLDKPGSSAHALSQLRKMQGRAHRLLTSLNVLSPTSSQTFTDITTVHLRPLSDAEIESYLRIDEPYDCAGSYKFEKAGIALVEKIETLDPSAIQGLPLISLISALKKLNITWAEMWRT